MSSLLDKRIQAKREKQQCSELLEFLKVSGRGQLYEDFLDDLSADDVNAEKTTDVKPESNDEKKFQFFFNISISGTIITPRSSYYCFIFCC